jgi:hypothetical protein
LTVGSIRGGSFGERIACAEGFDVSLSSDKKLAYCANGDGVISAERPLSNKTLDRSYEAYSQCDLTTQQDIWIKGYTSTGESGAIKCSSVSGGVWGYGVNNLVCTAGKSVVISADKKTATCQ